MSSNQRKLHIFTFEWYKRIHIGTIDRSFEKFVPFLFRCAWFWTGVKFCIENISLCVLFFFFLIFVFVLFIFRSSFASVKWNLSLNYFVINEKKAFPSNADQTKNTLKTIIQVRCKTPFHPIAILCSRMRWMDDCHYLNDFWRRFDWEASNTKKSVINSLFRCTFKWCAWC